MSISSSKIGLKLINYAKNLVKKTHARFKYYLSQRPHRTLRLTRGKSGLGGKKLPSVLKHARTTFVYIWREKKILLTLGLIFAVANYLVVGGVPQGDFVVLKEGAQDVFLGDWGQAGVVATLFLSTVAGAAANASTETQQLIGSLLV